MKQIAIPLETKVRELDGKLWLALKLVDQGHKVAFGEKSDIRYTLDLIKPDIYIEKSARDAQLSRVKKLNESGTKVFILDSEGGVFESAQDYCSGRLSEDVLNYVDNYLAWGKEVADIIENSTSFPVDKVTVTGNPRFDLLNKKMRKIYKKESKRLEEDYGEFILINTSFAIANNMDSETIKEKKNNKEKTTTRYDYEEKLIEKFTHSIHRMSSKLDMDIILRPHPSENQELYEEEFVSYENVHVRHEGDVRPWILASKAVVHNSCTTGIESAMLEVPVFAYRPIINKKYDNHLPNFVSKEIYSKKELVNSVQDVSPGQQYRMTNQQREELKRYFHNLDVFSSNLICRAVDKSTVAKSKNFDDFYSFEKRIERTFKQIPGTSLFKNRLGREYTQKWPGLSECELRDRINVFSEFVDCDDVKIERIAPWKDAYYLYN